MHTCNLIEMKKKFGVSLKKKNKGQKEIKP